MPFLSKILIQLAFQHAVIQFAALIGAAAEARFKFLVRADNRKAPTVFRLKHLAHRSIQSLCRLNIEQTFALKSVDGKRRYKGGAIELREA